jgi:3-oxoacyl-[acyl-carrier-protein] synthase-1
MKNRVVITGMGVVAPGAANLRQFDNNLKNGMSPVTFQAKLEQLQFNCQVAAVAQINEQETPTYLVRASTRKYKRFY